jgi:hypothetical protein
MSPTDPSQSVISCQKASCRCIYQKSVDILGPSPVRPEQQQPKKTTKRKKKRVCRLLDLLIHHCARVFSSPHVAAHHL